MIYEKLWDRTEENRLRAEVARLRLDLDAYAALEKLARDLGFSNIATALDALAGKGGGE